MEVLAPAKINLHLRVGKRRDDGFHPLVTWMCTVGLFDKLIFERARRQGIHLSCDRADVPADGTNLIVRAASAVVAGSGGAAAAAGPATSTGTKEGSERAVEVGGLAVRLEKRIPLGAGLGGGSSDGARTLLALKALMRLDLGKGQLEAVAASLGSDLSFFFHEPSAACRGRGELVEPITPPLPGWGVLVLPGIMMPTPAVYRRFDELGLGEDVEAEKVDWAGWAKLRSRELLERLVNDLEKPAFSIDPKLGQLREDVERVAGRIVRMSGSGSSLFTVFDEEEEAKVAAGKVADGLKVRAISVELAPKIRDDLHGNLATR